MDANNLHAVPLEPGVNAPGNERFAGVRVVHLPETREYTIRLEVLNGRAGAYERLIEQLGWSGARVRVRRGTAHVEATAPPPAKKVRVGDEEAEIVDVEERILAEQEAKKEERVRKLQEEIERLAAAGPPSRLPDNKQPRGPRYTKTEFLVEFGKKRGEAEWRQAVKADGETKKRQQKRLQAQLDELQPATRDTNDVEMRNEIRSDVTTAAWTAWEEQQRRQREVWEKERANARVTWELAFEKRLMSWADAQSQIATQREEAAYARQLLWMADVEQKLAGVTEEMNARVESLLVRLMALPQPAVPPQLAASSQPAVSSQPEPSSQPAAPSQPPPPVEASQPAVSPPEPLEGAAQEPLPGQAAAQSPSTRKGKKARKEADARELDEQLKQLTEATRRPVPAGKAKGGKGGGKQQLLTEMIGTANRFSPLEKK
ncbi:hypothetical protein DIPPA_24733 [Diplonema papillatum]|nr:hypothetical protein DIPPA_24733 [Diplonema papillatum]